MDEQLKRRLVGAAITVALLVIFVPMLFESKSVPPAGNGGEVPALPEAIEERTIELPKSAADVVEEKQGDKPKTGPQSGYRIVPLEDAPPKPAKVEPPPAAAPEENPAGAEAELEAPADEEGTEDIGEGAVSENPETPPKQPAAGVRPLAKPAAPSPAPAAPVIRSAAPAAQPKPKPAPVASKPSEPPVRKTTASKPQVPAVAKSVPVKPEAAAPKSAGPKPQAAKSAVEPAAPGGPKPAPPPAPKAWTVQAGSFAVESNARALADKLRQQNLAAVVHPSRGATTTIYRVTVGPETSRSRAELIQKQIETSVGIRGIILPHR